MALGLGVLGLSTEVFWAMTVKELEAAVRGRFGLSSAEPLSRGDLNAMIEQFPDR